MCEQLMRIVCAKIAAARSILDDGPDDSDAAMAAGYLIEAAQMASLIQDDLASVGTDAYLAMLHTTVDEAKAMLAAHRAQSNGEKNDDSIPDAAATA